MFDLALIGAGRIGRIHAANIVRHPSLRLKLVVDPVAAAADEVAASAGARAGAIDEVFDDPAIAGVVICSSTDTHLEYTLRAARAGKAVFCEKPLDLDLARAKTAEAELAQLDARVFLAFNRRFDPNFRALKDRIDAGAIGAIETLHIVSHDPGPPPVSYIRTSGGIFKDMVIHDFDMARWLLGEEPVEVYAAAACLVDPAIREAGDSDTAKTILKTASGKLCMISSSRRSGYGYDQRIEAFGSGGMVRAGNVTESTVEQWGETGAAADRFQNFFLDRYAAAYAGEIGHFAQVLAGEVPPAIDYRDGVAALALAEAAGQSAASGLPVKL